MMKYSYDENRIYYTESIDLLCLCHVSRFGFFHLGLIDPSSLASSSFYFSTRMSLTGVTAPIGPMFPSVTSQPLPLTASPPVSPLPFVQARRAWHLLSQRAYRRVAHLVTNVIMVTRLNMDRG